MKPTLVTGATGFIGWHVARLMIDRGHKVRDLEVETPEGDLRDPASLQRAVSGCSLVFHLAADYRRWAKNPRDLYRSNVDGTRALLQAAQTVKNQGPADFSQGCWNDTKRWPGGFAYLE